MLRYEIVDLELLVLDKKRDIFPEEREVIVAMILNLLILIDGISFAPLPRWKSVHKITVGVWWFRRK